MGKLRDTSLSLLSGEKTTDDLHPFSPELAIEELAPGAACFSGFANVGVVETGEGLLLVDVGSWLLAPQAHAAVRSFSKAPIHTALFTHGHVDHVTGVGPFEDDAQRGGGSLRVVAHRAISDRFRRYQATRGYNGAINSRQFGAPIAWPERFREPDQTFDGAVALQLGDTTIEVRHGRGETDDHAWAFVPSSRVLFTGDLFIWASPNAGNPQKVQRYPAEWAEALREMAKRRPVVLSPGHGPPIWGEDEVARALTETAELLEHLVRETLVRLNAGETLDEIVHGVRAPEHLLARPYLRPVYDEPSFVVRNVVRLYGGWWDGDPSHLLPAPEAEVARAWVELAGGVAAVLAAAEKALADGNARLASHLVVAARRVAPAEAKDLYARVFRARQNEATSLMAKGVFRDAAGKA